jgi:hypothetical protein
VHTGGGGFRVRRPIGVASPDLLVYLPGAGGSAKTQGRAQTPFLYAFFGQLVIERNLIFHGCFA